MGTNVNQVPTSGECFAVGEEGELEEQSTQQICSTHYTSHLIEIERGNDEKIKSKTLSKSVLKNSIHHLLLS